MLGLKKHQKPSTDMDVDECLHNDPVLSQEIAKQTAGSFFILFFPELSRSVTKQEVKSGSAPSGFLQKRLCVLSFLTDQANAVNVR